MEAMVAADVKEHHPANCVKGLLAVVVLSLGFFRGGKRDTQFFQCFFLLGAEFSIAVPAVEYVALMDVGCAFIQVQRPVKNMDMGAKAALQFFVEFLDDLLECFRRDGGLHRPDLVDALFWTSLVVLQQIRDGAVALCVARLLIPGILGENEWRVLLGIKPLLDLRKADVRLAGIGAVLRCGEASIAVPVDVFQGALGVNVLAVGEVEAAVVVLGVVGAVFAGAAVVSGEFQETSPPFKARELCGGAKDLR